MQSGSGALQNAWCPAAGANCTCVGVWVLLACRGCVSLCWLPALHHGTPAPAAWRPGLAVSAPAAAAAAQYGGGPVVLEPATSLNACTTMEHGSARPGFVGVHIGAGQHSEVGRMLLVMLGLLWTFLIDWNPSYPSSHSLLSAVLYSA